MKYFNIANIILSFGHIHRLTKDAEGRPESDTTHSLMLAFVACDLAMRENEHRDLPLNLERVLIFALVHDLCEVYAGDTPTLRELSADGQADKDAREAAALDRLQEELVDMPWIADAIAEYESQRRPEARLVKAADKLLPRLTHVINGGLVLREQGVSLDEVATRIERQRHQQRVYDLPIVAEQLRQTGRAMVDHLRSEWKVPDEPR